MISVACHGARNLAVNIWFDSFGDEFHFNTRACDTKSDVGNLDLASGTFFGKVSAFLSERVGDDGACPPFTELGKFAAASSSSTKRWFATILKRHGGLNKVISKQILSTIWSNLDYNNDGVLAVDEVNCGINK